MRAACLVGLSGEESACKAGMHLPHGCVDYDALDQIFLI
jgi:hypothetical protein